MNLDECLAAAAADVARTAHAGPEVHTVTADGRRRHRRMIRVGVACPLIALLTIATISYVEHRPAAPRADGAELLDDLRSIAATRPGETLQPFQTLTFASRPVTSSEVPHGLDGTRPVSSLTEVFPDGSGRTDSVAGSSAAVETFVAGHGPLFVIDPGLVLELNSGAVTVSRALSTLAGSRDPPDVLTAAGQLLTQPGVDANVRSAVFAALGSTAGVRVTSNGSWVDAHAGDVVVAFDATTSEVTFLGSWSEAWVIHRTAVPRSP